MPKVQLSPQDARNISQNTMYMIIKTDQFADSAGGLKDRDISITSSLEDFQPTSGWTASLDYRFHDLHNE